MGIIAVQTGEVCLPEKFFQNAGEGKQAVGCGNGRQQKTPYCYGVFSRLSTIEISSVLEQLPVQGLL